MKDYEDHELRELNFHAKYLRNKFRRLWISASIFWVLSLIVFIMAHYKLISFIYSVIASLLSICVQIGYILYIGYTFNKTRIKVRQKTIIIPSSSVIILKGEINEVLIKADKEIFSKNITSISPYYRSIFRICFELDYDTLPEFSVIKKRELNINTENLSKGIKFDKKNMHVFDISVKPEEKLNFKFDKDVKLKSFSVHEIYIP